MDGDGDGDVVEWRPLCNRNYRCLRLYEMEWGELDLKDYVVAIAPFGGPIALRRNVGAVVAVDADSAKNNIEIYSSAGRRLARFAWTRGKIVGWGWNNVEQLVIVTEDGLVSLYSLVARKDGDTVQQFHIYPNQKDAEPLIDARVWGTGVVVLTKSFQFLAVTKFSTDPRAKMFPPTGLLEAPTAWVVLEPEYTLSHDVEVFIASASGTIFVLDFDECQDQLLNSGPFTRLAVSSGGKLLACFTASGTLMVISTDFSENKLELPIGKKDPPQYFLWCGLDTVLMYWGTMKPPTLLMIGPSPRKEDKAGTLKFTYSESIALVSEIDGARIFSTSGCEFLQRVPDVTESIFKIGSTSPAALLYDAHKHFLNKNPRAYENIRRIKSDLADAVSACIEAAGFEFNQSTQRNLLKSASFGKCFLDFYNPDDFVNHCKRLRILNAVRSQRIGVPLTMAQYDKISVDGLVDRMINRNEHLLALRICEYMKLKGQRVLIHWACAKVQAASDSDPEALARLIVDKLSRTQGIPYARIACTAYRFGHRELALLLIDHESRAADQVPSLTYMGQDDLALVKAIQSGDTDLIYLVILHIKRNRSPDEFLKIIRTKQVALSLVIKFCKQQDIPLLKDLYFQQNNREDLGNLLMLEAYQSPSFDQGLKTLDTAIEVLREGKEAQVPLRFAEEERKLLKLQANLEKKSKTKFLGLSVADTVLRLLASGNVKAAEAIRSDFKISEKRYWWLKLRAFAEQKDWAALQGLAREKKVPPIGWVPFAEVCIANKQTQEAMRYIPKIQELDVRMKMWMSIGYWREAAEAAIQLKSVPLLMSVKAKCTDKETLKFIDQNLAQLA